MENGSGVDEDGEYSSSGSVELTSDGSSSLTLTLKAMRRGDDEDGRTYTLTIEAYDMVRQHAP